MFHLDAVGPIWAGSYFPERRMASERRYKAAVLQAGPVIKDGIFDFDLTFDVVRRKVAQAAEQGAKLVVGAEALIGGYARALGFVPGTPESKDVYRRYVEGAIEVPSPQTERLAGLAKELGVYMVLGVIEKDKEACTLYCSALFFDNEGQLVGKRRKLVPTDTERLVWGRGDGSTLPVIKSPFGSIGAAICWENYMPLLRTALYGKGVEVYCAPTLDDRDTWLPTCQHIAVEGRCWVLTAVQYFTEPGASAPLFKGGSAIISPFGKVVAGPLWGEEGVLVADIDLDEVVRGKMDLDVVGHYNRPDIFTLTVNERPNKSVVIDSSVQ
ncbi:unnamed protein product [Vitrella brassicaformis CCMP3155]|uniref:CN hydrolase domain-containing protein n=1 Tax=Vitrella brassicaformis (strain CCMP3155) TaxID=1169540 RepID=A0A0G4GCL4_VITBC|nr:unnamed protein product [Vitrella brassicaformis CCMP3155]|mmetsp:Transcript_19183/g.46256  ORF Transcript_19183/g.46256 Transcript_19183/m.46256 type:complete len:326 (-) Transcript_19183:154-1131(-)|eukprot:CEM26536.1 unnamed protein product [Vitrella brassicaformis CCMP3155]